MADRASRSSPRRFDGFFQTERYVYEWERDGDDRSASRSASSGSGPLITEPAGGDEVAAGDLVVRGVAWSGAAPIARVDVSVGDGPWQAARLIGERRRHSWQWWELLTRRRARPDDAAGPGDRPRRAHPAGAARVEPPRLRRQRHPAVVIRPAPIDPPRGQ